LVSVVLFILGAVGVALAAEVINIDLNGYNDNIPYIGNGAYDVGEVVWTVFYGGFGVPVGSARSEGLATDGQANYSSVYAAQVWLGDPGNHWYQWGSGLMDDGFVAAAPNEPNIAIFGQDAYQGIYDIYVYGNDAGSFKLTRYGVTTTQTVSGDANTGQFELGHNYVVFPNVDINNSNPADLRLTYTNKLNGLQLVKKKSAVPVKDGTKIKAGNYDVAGERNGRAEDFFGPYIFSDTDANDPNRQVGRLDTPEFMAYDITVDDVNQGRYDITVDVNTISGDWCKALHLYLDDRFLGQVDYKKVNPAEGETNAVTVNLFKGNHTVKWVLPRIPQQLTGFNIEYLKFARLGNVVMNNCADVVLYGLLYSGDLTATDVNSTPNCVVNIYDLSVAADNWVNCNNPDPDACP
ncbi:MAG: hypothetical protein MUO27_07005, partial [Sedimentisphaerales bacterium]|nr:hypothetical protein [Sedimentisphaerales bacterium]